ncbi:MAG: glycosyltransferase family 1 protein [Clostridia bacterium]|nr:glycosyltransferase family 1 protein [Clostridia bacterium]
MRLTMIAIGSTGDVRPYVLLGKELNSRGHDVKITAFAPFREMVEKEGLRFHPISGDVTRMMASVMKPGVTGFTYLQHFESAMKDVAPLLLRDLQASCEDAEGIICTFFGSTAYSIAEKNHIPCIQTQFFPMDYNASAPIASAPGLRLGKTWNKTTYQVGYLLISTLEKRYLTGWRKEQGMRVRKIRPRPDYTINGHTIPVLYALSPLLFPRPVHWNEHIHMTGFWTNRQREAFEPSQELMEFLQKGSAPVYIGFGSMVSGDMGETLQMVLDAVDQAGIRAILAKGWGGADRQIKVPKQAYIADYIPHDWLFQHVSAVVHHGGAGTTAAGLMAGKPTLVIPFGGDQPFWGSRVRALGCGPKPIRRDSLTVEKLTKALIDLTSTPAYQVAAQELGARLSHEDGVVNAANIIEREIGQWLQTPDV